MARMTNERAYEYAFTLWSVADHLAELDIEDRVRVLDVGTAGSQLPNNLADTWVDRVVCVDPDCRGLVRFPWQSIDYFQMTVQEYAAVNSEPFDIITCISTLEHAEDAEGTVAAMVELLKPGGLLVVTVPHHRKASRLWPGRREFMDVRPLHRWSLMFEQHGLEHDQDGELYLRSWEWVEDDDGLPIEIARERCRVVDDEGTIICMTWTKP